MEGAYQGDWPSSVSISWKLSPYYFTAQYELCPSFRLLSIVKLKFTGLCWNKNNLVRILYFLFMEIDACNPGQDQMFQKVPELSDCS